MLFDVPSPPVAWVCVDSPLPQLDRLFYYRIPDGVEVVPGCRVRVPFHGRRVAGFVMDVRPAEDDYTGTLREIAEVVSTERVLSPEVAGLARAVADRYVGTLSDVLRLAIPPRQVRIEKEAPPDPPPTVSAPSPEPWRRYRHGEPFLSALASGRAPRVVWDALPGEDWSVRLAEAAATVASTGRGALLIVPDQRDLDRLDARLTDVLGPDRHVSLSAALGPAKRYRAFLRVRRGGVAIVAGTRAAMFAPVPDLGLVAIWDDGDESHSDPRAPYPHAREVLLMRAERESAAAIVAGTARTPQGQLLVESGWAHAVTGERAALRAAAPRVVPVGDDSDLAIDPDSTTARLPSVAWRAALKALRAETPVLVQSPRRGYLPSMSCQDCRVRAVCVECGGPLSRSGRSVDPVCRWCARVEPSFTCPDCGGRRLRAVVIGAARTAEELGRAFAPVSVRVSSGTDIVDEVKPGPSIVVATPGAEPRVAGGYGAVLLLDTWAMLGMVDLRAEEEAYRRWTHAASLCRPASEGGTVVVTADGGLATVQALVRWDPAWFARRELEQRRELRFPPAVRMASVSGGPAVIAEFAASAELPPSAEVLGPVPDGDDGERLLIRAPRRDGPALAAALRTAVVLRAIRREPESVFVRVDPRQLW